MSEQRREEPPASPLPASQRSTELRAVFGSIERAGPWPVPRELAVRVSFGSAVLDLRDAVLEPGVTTFDVRVRMGNLEIFVPPELAVEVDVRATGGNVEEVRRDAVAGEPGKPVLRVIGTVKAGNCEVIALRRGQTRADRHHAGHDAGRRRGERELWRNYGRAPWLPWWLQARMRRRMFSWLVIVFAAGLGVGVYLWDNPRWWYFALAFVGLSIVSGMVAWRLTRPLIMVVRAARDIGDGKLDTRLPTGHHGEMRILAMSINDMADKLERQLADQRQLLAAVSHELRTPLGHMRVLVETARDNAADRGKVLDELDREVVVLDDLVGKLLASSRLEFGNLERRELDLGVLAADVATAAGVPATAVSADGDVVAAIDPTLVRRAIANLVDNARIHGGGAIAVRVVRRAGQIAFEVDDAGPGVPADRRADAFRAFVPSKAGGLGLGLALVSRIAVAHGGGAWIADRPGGGARVGFTVAAG